METENLPRPTVTLIGKDGNAFFILAKCARRARQAGWTAEQLDTFMGEAKQGDYNHLLATVQKYFEVE